MERIAISVDNNQVSAHFGRCPSFAIIELENKEVINQETISNPGHRTGFLPKFLAERNIHTIICGGMGKRAADLFSERGIKPIVGVTGEVNEVVERYIEGKLEGSDSLCQHGAGKGYGIEKEDHHHE